MREENHKVSKKYKKKRLRLAVFCKALNPLVTRLLSFFGLNALVNLFAMY